MPRAPSVHTDDDKRVQVGNCRALPLSGDNCGGEQAILCPKLTNSKGPEGKIVAITVCVVCPNDGDLLIE